MTEDTATVEEPDPDGPPEGLELEDLAELLWRQVIRKWFEPHLSSQAFMPNRHDRKRLSTGRSSMVTAAKAYEYYLEDGGQPGASWALTVEEAKSAEVPAYGDGGYYGQREFHASLYFGGRSPKQMETISKLLRNWALNRGCQYTPAHVEPA